MNLFTPWLHVIVIVLSLCHIILSLHHTALCIRHIDVLAQSIEHLMKSRQEFHKQICEAHKKLDDQVQRMIFAAANIQVILAEQFPSNSPSSYPVRISNP